MRIAVLNRSNRLAGGTEEYLRKFLPAAVAAGHAIGFLYESEEPSDREPIPEPPDGSWSVARLGIEAAVDALRAWQPDVIYAHGFQSPTLEARLYALAPTVFFAHEYYGTCISGTKTTQLPVIRPCERVFGPACLGHYFPRRCGGLSPFTMLHQYRLQARRLAILKMCAAVVTHSDHMRQEYLRNGLVPTRVAAFPYYILDQASAEEPPRPLSERPTVVFLGRMETNKGGALLIEALPQVRAQLGRPLRVVFAGDGRDRANWEAQARRRQADDPQLQFEFVGWIAEAERTQLLREADLLVVPSLWPEPFGRVGPEAGHYGVPAVAFDLGGTPSWLSDGENGYLVRSRPPSSTGLVEAITRCLGDRVTHAQLRRGAARLAARFTWEAHFTALMQVFRQVTGRVSGSDNGKMGTLS